MEATPAVDIDIDIDSVCVCVSWRWMEATPAVLEAVSGALGPLNPKP